MKVKITIESILALKPCYDEAKLRALFGDLESVTWEQVAECEAVPVDDRIWLGTKLMDDTQRRLFAVSCARYALSRQSNPDLRSVSACDIAERFAVGDATQQELKSAESAAWSAAWSVESAARSAESAESAAAWFAARSAWSAAWSVEFAARSAESAAWSAAWSAESAARSAESAESAARSAAFAARSAESAESAAQKRHLGYITNLLREDDDE
jgi:hypothetical protein